MPASELYWLSVALTGTKHYLLSAGAVLLEQNDEWQLQHRYMVEAMAELPAPANEAETREIAAAA